MGTTVGGLPYPEGTAGVNIPAHVQALANAADVRIVRRFTSAANRTTLVPSPAEGEVSYLSDVNHAYLYNGSAYRQLAEQTDVDTAVTTLNNPHRVHAYRTTTLSLATGTTPLIVNMEAEGYDTNNMWSAGAPSRITFTTSGLYLVIAQAMFGNNQPPVRNMQLRLNAAGSGTGGTQITNVNDNPAANSSAPLLSVFEFGFTAGEYIEMFVYQNSGSVQATGLLATGPLYTYIQARRVAA